MRRVALLVACLTVSAGCATPALTGRDARVGGLDVAALDEVPVCGHEVALELAGGGPAVEGETAGGPSAVEGELLAASPKALTVATRNGLETVPGASIVAIRVRILDSRSGGLMVWTVVGSISTLSPLLPLTLPVWLAVGIPTAASPEAHGWAAGPRDAALLSQYARFPQGLPPGWPPDPAAVRPCSGPGIR